ncbi:MAG: hypothetical protein ABH829_03800 [archaeon]
MRLRNYSPLIGILLLQGLSLAARAVAKTQTDSIPIQIVKSGWCMVNECSPFTLLFVIVPAFCVWFYRTFIRLGI